MKTHSDILYERKKKNKKPTNWEIKSFIKELGQYRSLFTKQEIKTLRGQAIAGDIKGARKGLEKLIKEAM